MSTISTTETQGDALCHGASLEHSTRDNYLYLPTLMRSSSTDAQDQVRLLRIHPLSSYLLFTRPVDRCVFEARALGSQKSFQTMTGRHNIVSFAVHKASSVQHISKGLDLLAWPLILLAECGRGT